MGLPGFISFSSGKSRYRSAGLGAAIGCKVSRITVSAGAVGCSAHEGKANAVNAAVQRSVRDTGCLQISKQSKGNSCQLKSAADGAAKARKGGSLSMKVPVSTGRGRRSRSESSRRRRTDHMPGLSDESGVVGPEGEEGAGNGAAVGGKTAADWAGRRHQSARVNIWVTAQAAASAIQR